VLFDDNRARTVVFMVLFIILSGCTQPTKRLHPDERSETEFGTGLTSQDIRSVCQRTARSMGRALAALPKFKDAEEPPTIAFLEMVNESNQYFDTRLLQDKISTLLIKNGEGRFRFLDRQHIDALRKEMRDKERGKFTAARIAPLLGADLYLTGRLDSIDRVASGGTTTWTRLSFRLVDDQSLVVWKDDYEIKKFSKLGVMYR